MSTVESSQGETAGGLKMPRLPYLHSDPSSALTITGVEERIASYRLPVRLRFSFPPLAPTSHYPGPYHGLAWDDGPSGLAHDDEANYASIIHVHFVQSIETLMRKRYPDGVLPSRLLPTLQILVKEMARMETFRMKQWTLQQRKARGGFAIQALLRRITGMYSLDYFRR